MYQKTIWNLVIMWEESWWRPKWELKENIDTNSSGDLKHDFKRVTMPFHNCQTLKKQFTTCTHIWEGLNLPKKGLSIFSRSISSQYQRCYSNIMTFMLMLFCPSISFDCYFTHKTNISASSTTNTYIHLCGWWKEKDSPRAKLQKRKAEKAKASPFVHNALLWHCVMKTTACFLSDKNKMNGLFAQLSRASRHSAALTQGHKWQVLGRK